jgi:hypothetical protein
MYTVGWTDTFIFMMYFVNFIINRCFQYKTTSNNYIFLLRGIIVELSRSNTFVQPLNFFSGFVPAREIRLAQATTLTCHDESVPRHFLDCNLQAWQLMFRTSVKLLLQTLLKKNSSCCKPMRHSRLRAGLVPENFAKFFRFLVTSNL